jgi:hypothetical protein
MYNINMNNDIKYLGFALACVVLLSGGFYMWYNIYGIPVTETKKAIPTSGIITLSQLQENKNASSCWVSVNNIVYNVTSYVSKHPGGAELYNGCGKELDNLFPQHPGGKFGLESNLKLIESFKIGNLSK